MTIQEETTGADTGGESVHDVLRAFEDATRPDEPEIRPPSPGSTTLFFGMVHEGQQLRDAVVRELRGVDEEALAHLDRRSHDYFTRVTDTIVSQATVSIGGVNVQGNNKLLRTLLMADRNKLFAAIMIATYGEDKVYEEYECPFCEALNTFKVHIPDYLEETPLEDPTQPWVAVKLRSGASIIVRYPTGDDEFFGFELPNLTGVEVNTRMLSRCLGRDFPNAMEYALNLSIVDRRTLVDELLARPALTIKEVAVSCSNAACEKLLPFSFGWADLLLL